MEFIGLWVIVVLGGNPGSTYTEFADCFPVVRQRLPFFVEDFNFKARHGKTCFGNVFKLLVFGDVHLGTL
jgi:hypothetical protein